MTGIPQLPGFLDDWVKARKGGKSIKNKQPNNLLNKPSYLEKINLNVSDTIEQAGRPVFTQQELERLCEALQAIPADLDHHTWVTIGMAIHEAGWGEAGLEIWDRWSRTAPGAYPTEGRALLEYKWSTFGKDYKGQRVTVASIYELAKGYGWVPSWGSSTVPFNNINGSPQGINALPLNLTTNPIRWLDTDKNNNPKPTCANTRVALQYMGVQCKYDLFHDRQYVQGHKIEQWQGTLADNAVLALRSIIRANWPFDPPTQVVLDALIMEGLANAYDPVLDYLDGLSWDGVPRLATWLSDYLGAVKSPFNSITGGLMLVAAVRRARQPGVKFDHMMVLEGLEYLGKSSAVRILAGDDNFSDQSILVADERKQQENLQGVWLYEVAELTGIKRAEIEHVKAFITRQVDRARPAYGRVREDRPRRCVLFGSTNDREYLVSQTGNRRFWPVKCAFVLMDKLQNDRDQLWAEASLVESRGVSLALPQAFWPQAKTLQESRMEDEPWDILVEDINENMHCCHKMGDELRITTTSLLTHILKIPEERWSSWQMRRLAFCMIRKGWEGPKNIRVPILKGNSQTNQAKGYTKNINVVVP